MKWCGGCKMSKKKAQGKKGKQRIYAKKQATA